MSRTLRLLAALPLGARSKRTLSLSVTYVP